MGIKKNKQLKITMKFLTASLLAVAAAAVKIVPGPKCTPKPADGTDAADIFDMIDQDASGDINAAEAMDALACMVEYGMIGPEDVEGAIGDFVEAAGSDLKLDKKEAKAALSSYDAADELAQEEGEGEKKKPKCPSKSEMEAVPEGEIFDLVD